MGQTNIDICSQALDLLGVPPISTFQDNEVAATCGRLYDDEMNRLIASHPWNFCNTMAALDRQVTPPAGLWTYQFTAPVDWVRPANYAVYRTSDTNQKPFKEYQIQGNLFLTDSPTLFMVYNRRPPENEWPPHFYSLAILAMAAKLAMPVTEDSDKATLWRGEAFGTPQEAGQGGYFKTAKGLDSQADPPAKIQDFELLDARLGGGSLTQLR